MKQVITKEDVSKAMEDLAAQGKRPTLAAIHAMLNHRGSMSTLIRLKSEIEAQSLPTPESADGLKAFRQVWTMAVAEGRSQQEETTRELRSTISTLAAENERLEGLLAAARAYGCGLEERRAAAESDLQKLRTRVEAELEEARKARACAGEKATEALQKLAQLQAEHATRLAALQAERDAAEVKAHDTELKLVRATALLEARAESPDRGRHP